MDVDAFLAAMRGFQPEAAPMDLGDLLGQAGQFGLPQSILDQLIARTQGFQYTPSFGAPDVFGRPDDFGLPQPLIDRAVARTQPPPPVPLPRDARPQPAPPVPLPRDARPQAAPPVPVQRSGKAAAPAPVARRSANQAPPDGMSPAERYAWQNDEGRRRAAAGAVQPPHQQSVGPGLADLFNMFAGR